MNRFQHQLPAPEVNMSQNIHQIWQHKFNKLTQGKESNCKKTHKFAFEPHSPVRTPLTEGKPVQHELTKSENNNGKYKNCPQSFMKTKKHKQKSNASLILFLPFSWGPLKSRAPRR